MKFVSGFLLLLILAISLFSLVVPDSISIITSLNEQRSTTLKEKFEPYEWNVSTPEAQGLDSNILVDIFQEAETNLPFLRSLLVVKSGSLIVERYFQGYDKDSAHCICSTSKSYISALVGIALQEGYLESLDQAMIDFFPEYVTPDLDPRKRDITLRHLLTMTSGFEWEEEHSYPGLSVSSDWVKHIIELPLRSNPGAEWEYCSAGTHLLSAILTKVTSRSTLKFAEQYLFNPLRTSIKEWGQDPQGYNIAEEMYLTARDMARFGYLYLNNGLLDSNQIVPAAWVEESVDYSYFFRPDDRYVADGYGYLWWLFHNFSDGYKAYLAPGFGGQEILNIPKLNMTIVTQADSDVYWDAGGRYETLVFQFVQNRLMPAIKKISKIIEGDLTIDGSQTFTVTSSTAVQGNIIVKNNAILVVKEGAILQVNSKFDNQYNFTIRDNAQVVLQNGHLSANRESTFFMLHNSSLTALSQSTLTFANYSMCCSEFTLSESMLSIYGKSGFRGTNGASASLNLKTSLLTMSYSWLVLRGGGGGGGAGGNASYNGSGQTGNPGQDGGDALLNIWTETFNFNYSSIYVCAGAGGGGGSGGDGKDASSSGQGGKGGNGGNATIMIYSNETAIICATLGAYGGGGGGGGMHGRYSAFYGDDGNGGNSFIHLDFNFSQLIEAFAVFQSPHSISGAKGGDGGLGGKGGGYDTSIGQGTAGNAIGCSTGGRGGRNSRTTTNGRAGWTSGRGLIDGNLSLSTSINGEAVDSDGDNVSNNDEVSRFFTNPLKKDSDADGLSDYVELFEYNLDPNDPDMDNDDLLDGEEMIYQTDPLNNDTDADTLLDGEEIKVYGTDPLRKDTDNDGMEDGQEIQAGFDPLDPFSNSSFLILSQLVIGLLGLTMVVPTILFLVRKRYFKLIRRDCN
ncbi:MAG: serine hydrolase [Candidatus Hermodarchaeota archaeon]